MPSGVPTPTAETLPLSGPQAGGSHHGHVQMASALEASQGKRPPEKFENPFPKVQNRWMPRKWMIGSLIERLAFIKANNRGGASKGRSSSSSLTAASLRRREGRFNYRAITRAGLSRGIASLINAQ